MATADPLLYRHSWNPDSSNSSATGPSMAIPLNLVVKKEATEYEEEEEEEEEEKDKPTRDEKHKTTEGLKRPLSPTEFINVPSSNSSKKLKIEVEENLFESGTSEDVILNLTQEKNKDDSSKKSEVKCPDFIVGKYCEKQKNRWIIARDKTTTLRISSSKIHGTFAIGVVHGSPDYFTDKITRLKNKAAKGIHPKKKDFTRGDDPIFQVWTDRSAKSTVNFIDLEVGKYGNIKMAIVHLAAEQNVYLNFNTESTALCLESMGQLWNLVILPLTEKSYNYEAGFEDIDQMEDNKIAIKIVSVMRRKTESTIMQQILVPKLNKILTELNATELETVYKYAVHVRSKSYQIEI